MNSENEKLEQLKADNKTLRGCCNYWQKRCLAAEAKLLNKAVQDSFTNDWQASVNDYLGHDGG